ncbi:GNAT family N-acetyltransferase [Methylobacillus gramineus]|uniref:GNAT family N-acetyltransferase n=1 Tax=Methylobacillus gramineus TaxID=755169 RepID=UPI001CFFDEA9|nr:GNAT family N-acetyltransferase [Methylobacillus gramineus]MCB5185698.1 GNAT family N-acetyltransferase [Methylobacillus gramineus]
MLTVDQREVSDPWVQQLIVALDQELLQIYPDMPPASPLKTPCMLVAALDATPLGCVALHIYSSTEAEIKRLYVIPSARARGIARHLLVLIEEQAVARGLTRMLVETGNLQPAAIALYLRMGYSEIAPFGHYVGNPVSRCFEKSLV